MVALPADCQAAGDRPDARRLDQLAQALCGCWVVSLPEAGLRRLLGAIAAGEDVQREYDQRAAAGGC